MICSIFLSTYCETPARIKDIVLIFWQIMQEPYFNDDITPHGCGFWNVQVTAVVAIQVLTGIPESVLILLHTLLPAPTTLRPSNSSCLLRAAKTFSLSTLGRVESHVLEAAPPPSISGSMIRLRFMPLSPLLWLHFSMYGCCSQDVQSAPERVSSKHTFDQGRKPWIPTPKLTKVTKLMAKFFH